MPVDEDTKKFLEEVKKGKPRRFVMICKGVSIVSLIAYKKGTPEKYKKEAKKEGKGQFYHGVISGKGMEIEFNLLRSDGYEKPPSKDQTLKDFLKTEANLVFKPTYQIVDALPEVSESEESEAESAEVSGQGASQEAVSGAQTSDQGTTGGEESAAESFKTRLAALVPRIKLALGTPAGDDAKLKVSEAGVFARKHDFARAAELLDESEQLLKNATGSAQQPQTSRGAAPADLFKTRLTEVIAQIKQSIGTPAGDGAKLKASEAGVFARKGDYAQANLLLEEAQGLLDQAPTSGDEESEEDEAEQAGGMGELTARLKDVQIQAAKLPEPAKSELQQRASKAMGGKVADLAQVVDALENDLARAMSAARVNEVAEVVGDRVSFRRVQLQWMAAQQRARQQLGVFVKALLDDETLQDDDRYTQLVGITGEILQQMPEFGSKIDDALVALDDAKGESERKSAHSAAKAALDEYSAQLESAQGLSALQDICDEAYGGISFHSELKNALDTLGTQLAKAS